MTSVDASLIDTRHDEFLEEQLVKDTMIEDISLEPLSYDSGGDSKSTSNHEESQDLVRYELFSNETEKFQSLATENSLSKDSGDDRGDEVDNEDKEKDVSETDSIESLSYIKEIIGMFKMSVPLSIGNFTRLAMYNIDSIFLGHLGTDQLAGAALSEILMEIVTTFVYSPAWSLNGVCSQAIGAGNPKLAGTWLQLAIGFCTIISLPALIVYWYIADIIGIFESDEDVIHYARIFSHFAGSWLLLGSVTMAIRGYLQSIEVILPLTIVPIITMACDTLFNWVLIYGIHLNVFNGFISINWDGLGFIGSPLATLLSVIVQLLLFYFWCFYYKEYHLKKNAWPGKWSLKETLFNINRVKTYSKIMIPNMISDATENWAYQVTVIMCATLPSSNVAALSCMFDFWGVLWSFYSGFGASTVTRIGKEIGKGNIKRAKFYAKVCVITGSIVTGILTILCITFSNHIGRLYSNDKEVINIMDTSVKIVGIVYFGGSIGWTASNVMESMSKNKSRGIIMVITAWFVYLPLALYLAFDNSNIFVSLLNDGNGNNNCPVCMIFWACLFVEFLRTSILWVLLIYKVDWKKQSMLAMIRSEINEEIIAKKLNLEVSFVLNEINKNKSKENNNSDNNEDIGKRNKNENENENDAEMQKVNINTDSDSVEYISLHNAETFSTTVEIETVSKSLIKDENRKLNLDLKLDLKKTISKHSLNINNELLLNNAQSQVQAA